MPPLAPPPEPPLFVPPPEPPVCDPPVPPVVLSSVLPPQADVATEAAANATIAARLRPLGGSGRGAERANAALTDSPQNGHAVSVRRTWRAHAGHGSK
jgi:hypothetical protein